MRVLVLGAGGFIGRHVVAGLIEAGHAAVACVRRPDEIARRFPGVPVIAGDLARDTDPERWRARLAGIDAIVNCAGVLAGRTLAAVHVDGPQALYEACVTAGVRRVVLVSAISADEAAGTGYALTKKRGEDALAALDLDWVILRPSLVHARGSYGGTSLLRGLAGFPFAIPLPGDGGQRFQPIHVDDLVRTVLLALDRPALARRVLAPVGPAVMTTREILTLLRGWLDIPGRRVLPVPMALIELAARIGDLVGATPLNSNAVKQIVYGNTGPLEPFVAVVGFAPRAMADALRADPSHVQDRWHARLYFLRPALRLVLGLMWLASGVIGFAAPVAAIKPVMSLLAIDTYGAALLAGAFCVLDVLIGIAVLLRWRPRIVDPLQLLVVLGYTLVLSLAAPQLWLDPLGPLLKNLPVAAAILALMAVESER